jgi:chromosome partitioning protein
MKGTQSMKIITLLNEKGGVGKTTLSGVLGVGLAKKGFRVLMIDADGQANLTSWFQLAKKPRFYDFCMRDDEDITWDKLLTPVSKEVTGEIKGQVYVIAGNEESTGIAEKSRLRTLTMRVVKRLDALSRIFDFAIFDTQPSPTMLHDVVSLVTDYLLFPTEPEPFSTWEGLKDSISHTQANREQALQAGRDVSKILGIVPNKFRQSTALHQHFVEDLRSEYGELIFEPIPLRTAISEQQMVKRFILGDENAPKEASDSLQRFVDEVCKRLGVSQ